MSENGIVRLTGRSAMMVEGPDARDFLHALVTADVQSLTPGSAIFSGLLSPQGKILCDFFIYNSGGGYLIDAPESEAAALLKRLTLYKLRSKIVIEARPELSVGAASAGAAHPPALAAFSDPRCAALGQRILTADDLSGGDNEAGYQARRIALMIPEGGKDYVYGDTFPHEAAYDQLGGADFRKGCYVGQEIVSRMEHRGTARKRIVGVEAQSPLPHGGAEILAGAYAVGALGSVAGNRGIALVRLDRAGEAIAAGEVLTASGLPITLLQPSWANYPAPGAAKMAS